MAESVVAPGLRRPSIFLRSPSLTVGLVIVALVLVAAVVWAIRQSKKEVTLGDSQPSAAKAGK